MSDHAARTSVLELLNGRQILASRVSYQLTPDWEQGRTIFGGILSALAAQAMRDVCGADWPLRALQTNFVGPVSSGMVHVDITLLRQGKNVRQVKAQILQAGPDGQEQVSGVLLGVFGTGRDSKLPPLSPAQPAVAHAPEQSMRMPVIPGLTPNFTQHLEMHLAEGALPFTGSGNWASRYHLRIADGAELDAELTAIILTDAGPTPALSLANGFAPASSVSWALELRPIELQDRAGLWRLDQDTIVYGEGYANDRAHLWTPEGQLAALGYQVVAVYA